jgi:mannose-6-phosphate isomerase-like protein (cupin superfamily)
MTKPQTETNPPPLPGGIGITHLKVYDTPAPDGLRGGSAHVHLACTEAYIVTAGQGIVQTLSAHGFHETELSPGRIVWFTPGVIHRLVNQDGKLEILVAMQNAGLPEAGDFVLAFPPQVLADPEQYFKAASLAASGAVYTSDLEAAHHRRDLSIEGFTQLRREFEAEGPPALETFYDHAVDLVQEKVPQWREVWLAGPAAAAQRTGEHLNLLRQWHFDHLLEASVHALPAPAEPRKLGMCGTLATYLPEGQCR